MVSKLGALLVSLAAVIAVAAVILVAIASSAVPSPSPLDGLIFRIVSNAATAPHGGGGLAGCPDNLPLYGVADSTLPDGSAYHVSTIQPSTAGVTAIGLAGVTMTMNDSGLPVLVSMSLDRTSLSATGGYLGAAGDSRGFPSGSPQPEGCPPVQALATSVAGDVYQLGWTQWTCGPGSHPACGGNDPVERAGCVAISRTSNRIAATVQLGPCTPSSFPPLPAGWATPATPAHTLSIWKTTALPDGTATVVAIAKELSGTMSLSGRGVIHAKARESYGAAVYLHLVPASRLKPGTSRKVAFTVTFAPTGGLPPTSASGTVLLHRKSGK